MLPRLVATDMSRFVSCCVWLAVVSTCCLSQMAALVFPAVERAVPAPSGWAANTKQKHGLTAADLEYEICNGPFAARVKGKNGLQP